MKAIIYSLFIVALVGCNTSTDHNMPEMPGVYSMQSQTIDDGTDKTVLKDLKQLKIYTDKYYMMEEYKRSGTDIKTPLDGVWKESSFYVVNGNDTTAHERTQYKVFFHGYFMYGQYNLNDSTNTHSTGMGFGTFKMENDHQIKETDLNSSFNIIPGQVYTIDIDMINENSYKQTLTQADGSKHIEIYQRLKS